MGTDGAFSALVRNQLVTRQFICLAYLYFVCVLSDFCPRQIFNVDGKSGRMSTDAIYERKRINLSRIEIFSSLLPRGGEIRKILYSSTLDVSKHYKMDNFLAY